MTHTALRGRQLDREIAEQIMGATWAPYNSRMEALRPAHCHGKPCTTHLMYATRSITTGEILEVWPECPAYSSSIEAAWQVVERMWDLGHELDHISHMPRLEGGDWTVKFAKLGTATCYGGYAHTPSAQLSICLAALKAMEAP